MGFLLNRVFWLLAIIIGTFGYWLYEQPDIESFYHELVGSSKIPTSKGGIESSHFYGGMPKSEKRLRVLENIGYVVGYDEKERNPAWVCYRLFRVSNPESLKRPSDFTVDTRTNSRVTHKDYTHSGYDRGHLAPNYGIVTRYGREAQLETFYMSNIVPQKAGLNRGIWRELEMKVAGDWANRLGEVWVITGTVYDHLEEELQSGVEIPDAFYKIVIDEHNGNLRVCSFLIPESATNQSYERFLTSIDRIEELTGLDFLHELPDSGEDAIEAWTPRQLPF